MKKLTLILLISFAFYNCGKKQKKESFEDITSEDAAEKSIEDTPTSSFTEVDFDDI